MGMNEKRLNADCFGIVVGDMRVLVACEFSGTVRDAFIAKGHRAYSCDLLPSEGNPENTKFHIQGDAIQAAHNEFWDLMIAHPPCTDIAVSGAAWFKEKIADGRQQKALDFVQGLMSAPIPRICIENPVSVISSKIRKPDQIIQPYEFGHMEQKKDLFMAQGFTETSGNQ